MDVDSRDEVRNENRNKIDDNGVGNNGVDNDEVGNNGSDMLSTTGPELPFAPSSPVVVRWLLNSGNFRSVARYRGAWLAVSDCISVISAAIAGLILTVTLREFLAFRPMAASATPLIAVAVPVCVTLWCSAWWGHYLRIKPFWEETRDLLKMILYTAVISATMATALQAELSRMWMLSSVALMIILCPLARWMVKRVLQHQNSWFMPLVVLGDPNRVEECVSAVRSDDTLGYRVAARVEVDTSQQLDHLALHDALVSVLEETADLYESPRLMLAFDRYDRMNEQASLVDSVTGQFSHVIIGRPMHGLSAANAEVLNIDKYDMLFVRMSSGGIRSAPSVLKRFIDIVLSAVALTVLAPVLALVALLVRTDGGPVLYASQRVGRGGVRFDCLKFRSMRVDADEALQRLLRQDKEARRQWRTSFKLDNDPRITAIGDFLRRTSLDELPQLWNVLRGDMSLVGPRPILPDELSAYGEQLAGYQGVSPGVTGLWQISGRNNLAYEERIALNLWYVRNWSLWLDLTILLRTAPALLGSRDAS